MSFWSTPVGTQVEVSGSGASLTLSLKKDDHECPPRILEFLKMLGWQDFNTCPDTGECLLTKNDEIHNEQGSIENGTHGYYYRWYEAIAYEYYKMMTIGGMVGAPEEKTDAA
jgi:hypothetical protein